MSDPKITSISWDWRASPSQEDLQHVLAPFGLFVYVNPNEWGKDQFGYLISNKQLDEYELADAATDDYAQGLDPSALFDRDAHRTMLMIQMNKEKRNGR